MYCVFKVMFCLPFCWALDRKLFFTMKADLAEGDVLSLHQHHWICPLSSFVEPQSWPSGLPASLPRCRPAGGASEVEEQLPWAWGSVFFLTICLAHIPTNTAVFFGWLVGWF